MIDYNNSNNNNNYYYYTNNSFNLGSAFLKLKDIGKTNRANIKLVSVPDVSRDAEAHKKIRLELFIFAYWSARRQKTVAEI